MISNLLAFRSRRGSGRSITHRPAAGLGLVMRAEKNPSAAKQVLDPVSDVHRNP